MPIEAAPLVSSWPAIYGPTDGIGVLIGDILLHAWSGADPDEHGIRWKLLRLDGWFDGWEAGNGTGVQQRTGADGAWVTAALHAGPRLIHVDGSMAAESGMWDDVTRAWDRLLAHVPFRGLGPVTASTGEGSVPEQMAWIRQEGRPILKDRVGGRAGFSLSLLAPDPRKYDAVLQSVSLALPSSTGGLVWPVTYPVTYTGVTTNSTVTVVNEGTWDSPPLLTVTGPCPPCRIANLTTGQALRVLEPVTAGRSLVIDVANGVATDGGQARCVLGSWWHLQPGPNTIAFSADAYGAAAQLTLEFRSAWK